VSPSDSIDKFAPRPDRAPSADDGEPVARQLIVAAWVIAAQALGLVAVALIVVIKTATGSPDSIGRALLGAGMALLGAVVLALGARGIYHHRPAARTPVMVVELLALPVGYSLGFQAGWIGYGGPIVASAVVVLYLVFTPPARAALDRRRDLET
jgi:hypothetical protein